MSSPTWEQRTRRFKMKEHPQARFIVDTLHQAGFIAYYAGGWVRDFLLQHPSDDIDIATNAPPETIQALFPHTVPIGIAFGIILVLIDSHQYEVATFRRDLGYADGRRPTQIEFSRAEEDAKRRDFTINGMFYDPIHEEVLDYVEGKKDLAAGIIRAIGNPHERIKEDRLRMIRAVRLSCRFRFEIEPATAAAIRAHASELFPAVAIERVVQELQKGANFHVLPQMLFSLHEFGLLVTLFPEASSISLPELKKRIEPLFHYPEQAPLIAFLVALFPNMSLEEQLSLCKKLKLSNSDLQFASFLHHSQKLLQRKTIVENVEWAYFYANASGKICLEIFAAALVPERRKAFFDEHAQRKTGLQQAIERIQKNNPVVKGDDLKKAGVQPGKKMGLLLKEAERIAFNEGIYESAPIINRLRKTIL